MLVAPEKYVDFAGEASKRSRWVLLALLVASIFGMAAYLAARAGAWPWDRLRELNVVQKCVNSAKGASSATCTADEIDSSAEMFWRWRYIDFDTNERIQEASPRDKPELFRAVIAARQQLDDQVEHHIQHQRDVIMDRTAIMTAPFLGFSFDVNDLGVVATVTFLSLLLVLMLSLRRERENIQILRAHVGDEAKREALALVSMRQVFTIVAGPDNGTPRKPNRLLANLDSLFLAFPLVVEGLITWMDISTLKIGEILSASGTIFLTITEGCGVVGSLALVALCVREQRRLRRELAPERWFDRPNGVPLARVAEVA